MSTFDKLKEAFIVEESNRRAQQQATQVVSAANFASNGSVVEYAGNASFLSSSTSEPISNHWLVDSGATSHMTPHRLWFYTMVPHRVPVRLANGVIIYSEGKGTVLLFQGEIMDLLYISLMFSLCLSWGVISSHLSTSLSTEAS